MVARRMSASLWMNAPRAVLVAVALCLVAEVSAGQAPAPLSPLAVGEVLTYRAESGRFGTIGSGTMRVEGPIDVRGRQALQLSFDFRGRIGIFRVSDRTRSWIERGEVRALRFERRERSPLGSGSELVEIFPDERRWEGADGAGGLIDHDDPLDELSFLYFLRTLPLRDGEEHHLVRHFDADRNPVTVRVVGRERITVPAGEFAVVVVEMKVNDGRVSTMRLFLTDDALRIPVRIESSAAWVGSTRMLLVDVSLPGVPAP